MRHDGPCTGIGNCFLKLMGWMREQGVAPDHVFSLSHDNPRFVAPGILRSDARVEIDPDTVPVGGLSAGIDRLTVPAGRYAVPVHRRPP